MSAFADQVVLVTGGTRGIGRACAQAFAAEGAKVALCGRSQEAAEKAAAELGAGVRGYRADIADTEAVNAMVKAIEAELGAVSILVNNAGLTRDGLLMRMKDEDWSAVIQANLTGVFHCCRAVTRGMVKQRYGRIVCLSSIVGVHGQAGQTNYAASKAGVIGFAKSLARELATRNVTVNVVAPGYIETDMTAGLSGETLEQFLKQIPMQRSGSAKEVAELVKFLASDAAAYITGAVIPVDGGLGM